MRLAGHERAGEGGSGDAGNGWRQATLGAALHSMTHKMTLGRAMPTKRRRPWL